jgi:hypothetical protein
MGRLETGEDIGLKGRPNLVKEQKVLDALKWVAVMCSHVPEMLSEKIVLPILSKFPNIVVPLMLYRM